jgi:hypothetical protein
MPELNAFSQTGPVAEILSALRTLQARDDYIETEAKRCGGIATRWWLGCGGAALIAFLCIFLAAAIAILGIPLLIIAVIAMVVCIIRGAKWSSLCGQWKRQDMEDRRIALACRFLEVIGQDIPSKANCSIAINFDGYQKHGMLVSDQRGREIYPIRLMKYEDFWFGASGKLHDGNRFRVAIEQIVRRKEKRKPKYTKAQERITEKVTLVLRVAPTSYPNWQQLEQTLQPGMADGLQVLRTDVRESVLRVVGVTPECVKRTGRVNSVTGEEHLATGDTLLRLFTYVYDKLQHCRPQATGQGTP